MLLNFLNTLNSSLYVCYLCYNDWFLNNLKTLYRVKNLIRKETTKMFTLLSILAEIRTRYLQIYFRHCTTQPNLFEYISSESSLSWYARHVLLKHPLHEVCYAEKMHNRLQSEIPTAFWHLYIKEVGFGKKYWIESPQDTHNSDTLCLNVESYYCNFWETAK